MNAAQAINVDLDDGLLDRLQKIGSKRGLDLEESVAFVLQRALEGVPRRLMVSVEDYKPQHIPIMLDPHEDGIKKQMRCVICGCPFVNYYGGVKLITYGIYDSNQNMLDGEEQDWFNKLGVPDEIVCQGRVLLTRPDGGVTKRRCDTVYYRIGV